MQHAKQTKITLFEALRAWLDDEIVADSWLDAYQVIRDSDHLNQGLDYLMSALTFDNETVKLGETLSKDLYGKKSMPVYLVFEGYQQCPFKHYASHGLKLK